jgi:tetratricopeptide (TPR) repeat protein
VVFVLTITTLLIVLHLATRPPYHVRQYRAGVAEIAEGSLDAAIGRFDRAVSEEGDQAHLLFARGVAYQIRGDDDRAILDLKRAADKWPDPIVLECCAYSELRHASAADVVAARTRYVVISQSEAPSAELELNLAYTYYVGKRMPQFIIQRTSIALELRPNWQPALYLRALGHYQLAKDATSAEQRAKASEASVQDFEKAISVAAPSARLYYDAAFAYRPSSGSSPTERFIELVRLAADQGASRQAIMSLGSDEPWENSEWFRRALAHCDSNEDFFRGGLHEIFVTRPSQEAIFAAFTNPQTMDFAVSPTRTTASRSR